MKKSIVSILVAASLVLGGAAVVSAQRGERGHGHHGERGRGRMFSPEAIERRIARLTERLSLDEHQVGLVREILNDTRTRAVAIRDGSERGTARRAQFEALFTETASRIDAVLNDAQRATFATMRTEMRARHEARRARREERHERREERREARRDGI